MIALGIHGFGRIGRAVMRAAVQSPDVAVVAVNDIHPDLENRGYLLRYDSVYGRFPAPIASGPHGWTVDGTDVALLCEPVISHVDWREIGVDVVVDAATTRAARSAYAAVLEAGTPAVLVTSSFDDADATVIRGVNERGYDPARHRLLAASTCDGTALAPVLDAVDRAFGVAAGVVTTLHPWLSYQPVVDAAVPRGSLAPDYWAEYGLGRAAPLNLIPKETTALAAVSSVLPELAARIECLSFRVPLPSVCAAQLVLTLDSRLSRNDLNEALEAAATERDPIRFETEPLVSADFLGERAAVVVDARWSKVAGERTATFVVWYDNEYGYAESVLGLARLVAAPAAVDAVS
jgi:glyceraldehyde 3-phosphate dehydrogenase